MVSFWVADHSRRQLGPIGIFLLVGYNMGIDGEWAIGPMLCIFAIRGDDALGAGDRMFSRDIDLPSRACPYLQLAVQIGNHDLFWF